MQEQTKGKQTATASGTKEPTQSPDLTFRKVLDQQIAEAIRPVLDEFRQQMTQELEQRAATVSTAEAGAQRTGADISVPPVAQPEQQQPGSQSGTVGGTVGGALSGAQSSLAETLRPELEAVEQQTASALQSALAALVTALLAETSRAVIQRQAEGGLHAFIQKLFEALPDGTNNQQMQMKTERLLQSILQEFLDAIFAQTLRMKAQQDGQQAIQSSFHGDFGGALKSGGDLVKAIVAVLVGVLRRNQQNLMRLALAIALFMLAGLITRSGSNNEPKNEPKNEG